MLKQLMVLAALEVSMSTSVQAVPRLRVQPVVVPQGQQLRVDFDANQKPGPFMASLAGQEVKLYRKGEHYLCYFALPADQKPGGYTLQVKGDGLVLSHQKVEVKPARFATQAIRFYRPQLSEAQKAVLKQEETLATAARQARSDQPLWVGSPFYLPVPHRVSSLYGNYRYLNGKYNGFHGGVDFASPMAYPVRAPAAGRVSLARYFSKPNSNGNTVFLDHGLGVTSAYIHLSKIAVKEGQVLAQGDTLGYIGSTGRSTGPHLHWGLYINGQNTDGLAWIQFTQQPLGQP